MCPNMRTIRKFIERGSCQAVVDQEVVLMRPRGVDKGHEGRQPFGLQNKERYGLLRLEISVTLRLPVSLLLCSVAPEP